MNVLMSFDWPPMVDLLVVKAAACISASYAGVITVMWFERRLAPSVGAEAQLLGPAEALPLEQGA